MNVPFLQTATFTGLVSTDEYYTSKEWSEAYDIATFYSQNSAIFIEQTTFNEIKILQTNNLLNPGQFYLINDFQLMWWGYRSGTSQLLSSTVVEPLIVQATDTNKVATEAYSVLHPEDIVYYDINATTSTTWNSGPSSIPNFKGWIYRRIDQKKNIDIPWDWRYITHNCCRYNIETRPLYSTSITYGKGSIVRSTGNKLYISVQDDNTNNNLTSSLWWKPITAFGNDANVYLPTTEVGSTNNFFESVLSLSPILSSRAQFYTFVDSITTPGPASNLTTKNNVNNITIKSPNSYHIIFNCQNVNNISINNISIDSESRSNIFSNSTPIRNIRFGNSFIGNIIAGGFSNSAAEDNFQYNSINITCQYNIFTTNFRSNIVSGTGALVRNTFKDNASNNTLDSMTSNTVGDNFTSNAVINNFNNNIVGGNCGGNIFGSTTTTNTFGDSFRFNTLQTNCTNNIFGNNCSLNIIGSSFQYNRIGNTFSGNTIDVNATYNSIGNDCSYNTIGLFFSNNTIENGFSTNTIGTDFQNNNIRNFFSNNTILDIFQYNNVANEFQNNIVENNFIYNNIGNNVNSIDFTGASHVYNTYDKVIFKNIDGVTRLSYYNSTDQLVVTDPNS